MKGIYDFSKLRAYLLSPQAPKFGASHFFNVILEKLQKLQPKNFRTDGNIYNITLQDLSECFKSVVDNDGIRHYNFGRLEQYLMTDKTPSVLSELLGAIHQELEKLYYRHTGLDEGELQFLKDMQDLFDVMEVNSDDYEN